jgi:hypothetical protein
MDEVQIRIHDISGDDGLCSVGYRFRHDYELFVQGAIFPPSTSSVLSTKKKRLCWFVDEAKDRGLL